MVRSKVPGTPRVGVMPLRRGTVQTEPQAFHAMFLKPHQIPSRVNAGVAAGVIGNPNS